MNGSDEITGQEDILTEDQIRHRVWYIEHWDCTGEDDSCQDEDCPRHGVTAEELAALKELQSEISEGETLISEDYFPAYVRSERQDQGGIPEDLADYIEWDAYTEDQRSEYSQVTFRGTTYYVQ